MKLILYVLLNPKYFQHVINTIHFTSQWYNLHLFLQTKSEIGVSLTLSWISICISHILSTHLLHVVKVAITYDHVDLDREEWVDSIKTGGRVVNFILKEVCYFWWYFNELIWGFMFPKSLRRLEKKRDRIYRKSQYWNKNDEKNVNERVQNKNLFLSNIKIIIFGKHRSIPIF